MSKLFSFSFSLTPPATPKPKLHEYGYSEFFLALPAQWTQVPTAEDNTVNFHSAEQGAGITVSADFYEIPDAKAHALAEMNLSSRLEALEQATPSRVVVWQRSIKPHSGGAGLELSFAAEVPGEHIYIYLGYVTSRKILNFTLVCKPGKEAAAALFSQLVPNFQPRLP
ncbi:hypothetical protein [Ideonella sp. YS5]|uniref:hypothetical protein n=1 Tax=Ideonella sp. YS5 TaxID=3453714 RepID=UPI003EE83E0E